jgi:hypothetical protein
LADYAYISDTGASTYSDVSLTFYGDAAQYYSYDIIHYVYLFDQYGDIVAGPVQFYLAALKLEVVNISSTFVQLGDTFDLWYTRNGKWLTANDALKITLHDHVRFKILSFEVSDIGCFI